MKKIKLMRDYNTSPLWIAGGEWMGRVGPIDLEELPLSDTLKNKLKIWQKWKDDYYRIMEIIPGGGWSYHTKEEFESARKQLGIPQFPGDTEDETEGKRLLLELRKELPADEYEIILE